MKVKFAGNPVELQGTEIRVGQTAPDFVAVKNDLSPFKLSEVKGKKLIVNKGTTADSYFSKNHPEVELLKYDQNTEAFNALRDGRGVALAHDNTLIFAWVRENPGFVTGIDFLGSKDTIAPAVKKGNTELLNWLNKEIEKLYAEKFFSKAYDATLKPVYGDSVDPKTVVIDGDVAQ